MLKILRLQVWKGPQLALLRFTHAVDSLPRLFVGRQGRTIPTFIHRKSRDTFACELGELHDGFAKWHHGAHSQVGWQAQELLYLGFLSYRQRGNSAAIPFM